MDFISIGQIRTDSAKVWDKIAAGQELVILRKGKPIAIMVAAQPCEIESKLLALRAARFVAALPVTQHHVGETTPDNVGR